MKINKIREKVLDVLYQNKNKYLSRKDIINAINITKQERQEFRMVIKNLEKNNLIKSFKGRFKANEKYNIGYLQIFEKDKGYIYFNSKKHLVVQNTELDVYPIHGDKVLFEIVDKHMLLISVVSIIKRKKAKTSGTYVEYNGIGFVISDNNKIPYDIYIVKDKITPQPYDRLLVKIEEYKVFGKPEGIVDRKLFEDLNKEDSYLEQIINKYEIEVDFPNDVIKKASSLNVKVGNNLFESRVDLTDENIFTIDGKDAKDFDDAISVQKTEDGYILGVYIADVTYYVQEHDVIDKNAFKRGTSYYLDNVCIPMLPTALSNGVCSLNENENKLVIGVKMHFNKQGHLLHREIFEGIMCSKKRFTYEEINQYLKDGNEEFYNANINLMEDLHVGLELAEILRKNRMERGCIDFKTDEVVFIKDEDENIVGFKNYERGPANKLIEEFMLVTNQTIAQLFTELNHPFVYRTHQSPFKERIERFLQICQEYGIDCSCIDCEDMNAKQFQLLLDSLSDNPNLKKCINLSLITAMKQARYTSEHGPHFGLATDYYCHFTSPIRRYPDLFIHRLVKKYIRKTLNNDVTIPLYEKEAEKVAKHCCYTERNADKAEEELNNLQIMDYMINNPEVEYDALIYAIGNSGLSILVNDVFSGTVKLQPEEKTAYEITVDGKTYKVGDKIKVYFKEYEVKHGRIIFKIVEDDANA
jgi:ribonuclease R